MLILNICFVAAFWGSLGDSIGGAFNDVFGSKKPTPPPILPPVVDPIKTPQEKELEDIARKKALAESDPYGFMTSSRRISRRRSIRRSYGDPLDSGSFLKN